MESEPVERIKALGTVGYYIADSVFEIDAQVARQLVTEGVVEIIAAVDYDANPINILPGPGANGWSDGTGTPSGVVFNVGFSF